MRICLVRCPSPFLIDERAFPPLGLMAVGAGLREAGYDVTLHDGDLADLPMDQEGYGFGPTSPEYPAALECLGRIKRENPAARVVLGGAHATLSHEVCGRDGWDCVVIGDGEWAAELAFAGDAKEIIATQWPIDCYPVPDRTLVDLRTYSFTLRGRPTTTLVGSRGCPHRCAFCCKNYRTIRLLSAERMIEEIDLLYRNFGYDALAFPEDVFILDRRRTEAVCRHLRRLGIIWRCLVRADLVVKYGAAFLDMMVDCGCVGVGLGIESGSDRILKAINKDEDSATMMRAVRMLKRAGIYTKGFFILGLPGEDEESLAATERFIVEAELDDIDCKIFQPYPGSPIWEHPERYDVRWDAAPLEDTFYKGRPADYRGSVSTSALSTDRIVEAWNHIEATYKDWDHVIEGAMCGS